MVNRSAHKFCPFMDYGFGERCGLTDIRGPKSPKGCPILEWMTVSGLLDLECRSLNINAGDFSQNWAISGSITHSNHLCSGWFLDISLCCTSLEVGDQIGWHQMREWPTHNPGRSSGGETLMPPQLQGVVRGSWNILVTIEEETFHWGNKNQLFFFK